MAIPSLDLNGVHGVQGNNWLAPTKALPIAQVLSQNHNLPQIVAKIVADRIPLDPDTTLEENIASFLSPRIKQHLPEPHTLDAMELAVARTKTAILQGENIGIICDYDVDGSTSGAILVQYFRSIGQAPTHHVPERLQEGYGPHKNAIQALKDQHQISLLFTLDCGTSSHETLQFAKELGIDVIVIDHHQTEPHLPSVYAMINPKKPQDTSGLDILATVGLVFLFLVALNRALRGIDQFQEPKLIQLLDLVALGTVCDMVPLVGINRLLVKQGLALMRNSSNHGLRALIRASGIRNYPSARDLGFSLGPPINAASRTGQSSLAIQLFTVTNKEEAISIAHQLIELNRKRRRILEKNIVTFAQNDDTFEKTKSLPFVHIAHHDIHLGVAGLLASRIALQQKKPAFISAIDPQSQTAKGSARSVDGFDLGACLHNAKMENFLEKAGGHAMAGGYSLPAKAIPAFDLFLEQYLKRFPVKEKPQTIQIDVFLPSFSKSAVQNFADNISALEPFGMSNPEPVVLLSDVVFSAYILRESPHIICNIAPAHSPKSTTRVMAFHAVGTTLGNAVLEHSSQTTRCHALVTISGPSSYNGKPSIRLLDIGWNT